jgi:hypothetical protein
VIEPVSLGTTQAAEALSSGSIGDFAENGMKLTR